MQISQQLWDFSEGKSKKYFPPAKSAREGKKYVSRFFSVSPSSNQVLGYRGTNLTNLGLVMTVVSPFSPFGIDCASLEEGNDVFAANVCVEVTVLLS
jgi:hypothetical protein